MTWVFPGSTDHFVGFVMRRLIFLLYFQLYYRMFNSLQEKKGYYCRYCKKLFSVPWYLRDHEIIHTGEKPYEPPHDKSNKMTCVSSEDSDQPVRPTTRIRLHCLLEEALGPQLVIERTAKTDQTVQMPRLTWVFAGCTDHSVAFVMRRLISYFSDTIFVYIFSYTFECSTACRKERLLLPLL